MLCSKQSHSQDLETGCPKLAILFELFFSFLFLFFGGGGGPRKTLIYPNFNHEHVFTRWNKAYIHSQYPGNDVKVKLSNISLNLVFKKIPQLHMGVLRGDF